MVIYNFGNGGNLIANHIYKGEPLSIILGKHGIYECGGKKSQASMARVTEDEKIIFFFYIHIAFFGEDFLRKRIRGYWRASGKYHTAWKTVGFQGDIP